MAQFSIVYVLSNAAMPDLVKIGMTASEDAEARLAQLYTTGVPFPFKLEFACRVANPDGVERALHTASAPNRVNSKREFFSIDAGQAIAILKLLHTEDATAELSGQPATVEQAEVAAGERYRAKRPRFNFEEMRIPLGSVLAATAAPDVTVTVTGARRARLGEQEMSLTAATKQVLGLGYAVAPGAYWTFDGKPLREIYDQTYPPPEDEG